MSRTDARTGDTLTLRPAARQWRWTILISVASAVIGVFMLLDGEPWGWAALALFGLGSVVAIVDLVLGVSHLRITRDGLDLKALWWRVFCRWEDVGEFGVLSIEGNKRVSIRFAAKARRPPRAIELRSPSVGILPDTYGMSAEALADLLNAWRDRALSKDPSGERFFRERPRSSR